MQTTDLVMIFGGLIEHLSSGNDFTKSDFTRQWGWIYGDSTMNTSREDKNLMTGYLPDFDVPPPNPAIRAERIASVRLATCSLAKMFEI